MLTASPPALGPLLRGLRHAAGMTLEELAAASGVSDRAIGDMERGHSRGPQARTVRALADALRLGPEDADRLLAAARDGRRHVHREADRGRGLCDLPPAVPDIAGRARELAWLESGAGTDDGSGRTVTIVSGGPGLGKTTLVVTAAHRVADRFADGCHYVNLRGLDARPLDPHDVLGRLLRALGVRERDLPADPDERPVLLRRLARERGALVILDNAADEAQLRPLLPGEGRSTFWVTSRRALTGIEHARRLTPGPLPTRAAAALLGTITARRPAGAREGEAPAADLERIADLCGGLPLALRIAGNRLASRPAWSAADLADRLAAEDRRLDRLTAGDLRVKSAFTLSYEQLTPAARLLFRRLSLVPGPDFDPALGAVLTSLDLDRAEQIMDELVELGLLNPGAGDRASFHDLVRLYAHQRLREEESAERREAARAAMNTWLLGTASTAGQWFEPGPDPSADDALVPLRDQQAAEAWLRAESVNWLAALRDSAAAGEHRTVVDVAESMHWFSDRWAFWGHWHTVFELSRAAARSLGDPALEATHANYLSWAYRYCQRRFALGRATALEAAELARRAGDTVQEAWSLAYATHAGQTPEDHAESVPWSRRAIELFAAAGDKEAHPQALMALGRVLRHLGRNEEAVEVFRTTARAVSDPRTAPARHIADYTEMNALSGEAAALLELGRHEEAVAAADRALSLDSRVQVPALRGFASLHRARALRAIGRDADAVRQLRVGVAAFTEGGDAAQLATVEDLLAEWTGGARQPG
ncbi:ATP-binding protein [Streptomyces sp. NPDC090306]|uniref:ATP-binding protein n=1 Tax=Streptomyces sp. NPDC090306 TaxID=3365961 RepID=UPI00380A3F2D